MSGSAQAVTLADKHFIDWFENTFPYGYGTGEQYTTAALLRFFSCLKDGRSYRSDFLEGVLGATVAWLMIGCLCRADVFEYGTSPRGAWLTEKGLVLAAYLKGKTAEQLYEIVSSTGEDYIPCYPDLCNCDKPCKNPMFTE